MHFSAQIKNLHTWQKVSSSSSSSLQDLVGFVGQKMNVLMDANVATGMALAWHFSYMQDTHLYIFPTFYSTIFSVL